MASSHLNCPQEINSLSSISKKINLLYQWLWQNYGPQGWWPLSELGNKGYHPRNYSYPKNFSQRFEIAVGAVLTQNTAWLQVEKAIFSLRQHLPWQAEAFLALPVEELGLLIRSAGYYNQKAGYLRHLSAYFLQLQNENPDRQSLLALKGIGLETADSILLYAFQQPEFVVDAYTKRIFQHLGLIAERATYQEIKSLFTNALPLDVFLFQEYHALIVEHAKRFYNSKPYGRNCPLKDLVCNI